MLKYIYTSLLAITLSSASFAQDFGISASFFIPKNGYFSTPISPLSIRGVKLIGNNIVSLDIGGSLYRISGMSIIGVPFESKKPMVGPFFNIMIPLEAVIHLGNKNSSFLIKGGGFAFYNLSTKLNYGNIDRAIKDFNQTEIVNSEFEFDNTIGHGYEFGIEYIQYINPKIGITLGANYYIGDANLNLRGTVKELDMNGLYTQSTVSFPNSKLDYTGTEFSLGLLFSSGRR